MIKIKHLVEQDIKVLAEICSNAFINDPGWCYFIQKKGDDLKNTLKRLNEKLLYFKILFNDLNLVAYHEENGKLLGMISVNRKEHNYGILNQISAGFWKIPMIVGFFASVRLINGIQADNKAESKFLSPNVLYYRIDQLFVDPSAQGKGIGTMLVSEALKLRHEDRKFFLGTMNPKNIAFYKRIGFEHLGYEEIDEKVTINLMVLK